MANVYCTLLKFCAIFLIFTEFSQSKQINADRYHHYDVEDSQSRKYLENVEFVNGTTESTTSTLTDVLHSDNLDELIDSCYGHVDEISKPLNTIKTDKIDYFLYYNSTKIVDKNKSDEYWATEKEYITSRILSKSHRRAITVQLKFDFPFYGHIVHNVTIAAGGFLYTGEFVHRWLAAAQYIAPLMGPFDTSLSEESIVKYSDNGTAFTVIWDKVPLQYGNSSKSPLFTFSVTLFNTGDITFAYRTIPIFIENIKDKKHPVKIGLSDAYIIEQIIYFVRRKTIYEYHRVNFNGIDIKNDMLIIFKPLPTCLDYKDCNACLNAKLQTINCVWCQSLNMCSNGFVRTPQERMEVGCEQDKMACSAIDYVVQKPEQQVNTPQINATGILYG